MTDLINTSRGIPILPIYGKKVEFLNVSKGKGAKKLEGVKNSFLEGLIHSNKKIGEQKLSFNLHVTLDIFLIFSSFP